MVGMDTSAFAGPVLTANSARLISPCATGRLTTPDWPKSDGLYQFVSMADAASTVMDLITTASVLSVTQNYYSKHKSENSPPIN